MRHRLSLVALVALTLTRCSQPLDGESGPLARAFREASRESGVPERLLLAVGYVETRWHTPAIDEHAGEGHEGHGTGARGLMGVIDRKGARYLSKAALDLGLDAERAASDGPTNVRVAAEALRQLALKELGEVPAAPSSWRPALARYGSGGDVELGRAWADEVLRVLSRGAAGTADGGEQLSLSGTAGKLEAQNEKGAALDYPGAHWVPARAGHYVTGRYGQTPTHVIIHTTEGSYQGAISWFRSASNPYLTSAHYVIRSSDGEVTQMVRESDTAHHIGDWNPFTVGIEHEAIANQGYAWFTEAMYRSSAALTRYLCLKYGIPMDREHIRGHVEVPGATHYDPGQHWDWNYYMSLVLDPSNDAPAPPTSSACGELDYQGLCDGSVLRWCEAGAVRQVNCANSGQACGWQNDSVGNNCVAGNAAPPPPPADPCGGLDYHGRCSGTLLEWCENGQLAQYQCSLNGQACGWQDDTVGNNCVDGAPEQASEPPPPPPSQSQDPCGGLDYHGACDGSLLMWCENGQAREYQCAGDGQTCGWQDDTVGNNCVSGDPCGGLDYYGQCSGTVLEWCEGGAPRSFDCASTGQSCGWQNNTVGNNCL